jgi:beta-galactosidase
MNRIQPRKHGCPILRALCEGWDRIPFALLLLLSFTLPANPQAPKPYLTPHAPLLGSAWYPEQWPESRWDADLTLMEQAHMNVVRIGEFAWSALEPSEGHYELGWMDRAIALAARHHIAVVIGTPTDAPPAWLTSNYPDTLGMNADGHLREHGNRRQFNYASPRYRQLCALIVAQLAQRFGHNPNVIGWQIGNEYTDESFDPATRAQFQQFLRDKYKTLANLNQHWATAYWSQTYDRWDEIPMENTNGNPGLLLDHKHFVTATWRSFQRVQIDTLRASILPTQFITTNIGGLAWSDNWDHYAITADLNLASWDDYVGQGHLQVSRNAMLNDFARGWKRQNFWIMETQPGSVNWAPINNALSPGETRALAWQAVGHGADAILYWQWRAALNGQEEYHGAIVGPDGSPLPLYPEIQHLGADFARTAAALANTTPHAEIALLHDYDARWAIDFQPHTRLYDQQQVLLRFYTPLDQIAQTSGHAIDIIDPTSAPLDAYKLLVAPSLNVLSPDLAAKLIAYVRQGGHLLLGPRSGMKDQFNSLNPQRQPGPLADALGAHVAQFYALEPDTAVPLAAEPPISPPATEPSSTADIWAEALVPTAPNTHVDLRYGKTEGGWLDNQPAMVTRSLGKGTISYLGTLPALLHDLLLNAATQAHAQIGTQTLPPNVELCVRSTLSGDPSRSVYILINHADEPTHVSLAGRFHSLLPEITLTSAGPSAPAQTTQLDLPSQGVAVLTPEPKQ